jgi:hypothetical protein
LLEPEPVQSLPMEVKEVFSRILLFLSFPVCLCVCRGTEAPSTELTEHMKIAPLPFLSDSNTDNVAVPVEDKNPKKIGTCRLSKIRCKRARWPIRGDGEGRARIQP